MELKIDQSTKIKKKVSIKSNSKSSKQSFQDTLQTAKAFSSSFNPLGHLSDNGLKAVNKLEKIFDVKITNSNFKANGYLDIMTIIRQKGDKLSPPEVKELRDTLIIGVNSNLIGLKDAYEVLKWLKARILLFKVKDDEMKKFLNIIDQTQKPIAAIKDK